MAGRIRRVLLWVVGIVVGLPVVLVLAVLVLANTGPGRTLIAQETMQLTGGMVNLSDISGRFPDALRVGHIAIRDSQGVWLSLDGLQLDWSPLALIGGVASVQNLSAGRLSLPRLPAPGKTAAKSQGGGFSLPVKIHVARISVARASIGAPVAGRAAVLRLAGNADLASLDDGSADIAIDRLDSAGTYRLVGRINTQAIAARLTATEPAGGFVGSLAGLPDLGAMSLDADIAGPRSAEATHVTLAAGPLRLAAAGLIDLAAQSAALDLTGAAPAMAPRPDLSWQSLALTAHVHGPFTMPEVAAHAALTGLATGGARVATLTADAGGNQGAVDAHLVMDGIVLPAPKPDMLANGPLDLTAHIALDQPARPVAFTLKDALLTADGTVQTAGGLAARLHLLVPNIAPLAALGGADLQGRTEAVATLATHGDDTDFAVDGTTEFTGGQAPVPTLLGPTRFGVTARLNGQDFTLTRADVQGRALAAHVTGTDLGGTLDLAWTLAVSDLSAAAPALIGALQASGHVQGPQTSLGIDADVAGDIGTREIAKGPVKLTLHAGGVPGLPSGTIDASGRFDGAPVTLQADLQKSADGALHALLRHAAWKSFTGDADLALAPGANLPAGRIKLRMARLADLAPLLKQKIGGSFTAGIVTTDTGGRGVAKIDLAASALSFGDTAVARLALNGQVADPAAHPDASLALTATGIAAGGVTGEAQATLRGPQNALGVQASATLQNVAGGDASFGTRLTVDAVGRKILLSSLEANTHGETLRLVAPARLDVGASIGVDRLRLALGSASLDIAGKVSPALSLTAALRGVTPDLAKPFVPGLDAAGLLSADARLTGTMARPQGSVRIAALGLRARRGPAASLAPASAQVTAMLQGDHAALNAHASAGPKLDVSVTGGVPIGAGAVSLQTMGHVNLALLDPILGATGQRAEGLLSLNGSVGGTVAAPSLGGTLTLAGGEVQDFVQGVRVQNIGATIEASGETIRIAHLSGQAGDGTISATGSLGLAAPGMPIDLHISASGAKPLASDRLTTTLDASIDVTGQALAEMLVSGRIFLRRTDINIPDSFPTSVAKLNVIRPGQKPPPPPAASSSVVRLALTIDAPSGIFVRGHGLDAELGGKLSVGGTAAAPDIGGGFELRRGDFSLAGTTLQFSKGEVSFNGSGVDHAIDPTLDFEADSIAGGITATLAITGYADAPVIKLSSVPDLPQDEVLAHLLFGTSVSSLSPLQIGEIAAAVAELSGVGGGGAGALGTVRNTLGLDRLNVSGGSGSTGATVEAGRYVARGVYVGAKQATSGGGGTIAQVQIDLTRHLKATAQVGTGGGSVQGATPENDTGSTLGLSYRFEY
jgi:translocation and assembly module TamB